MADCALLKLFVHAETHQDVMGSRRTQVVAISINHQSITIIATGMPLLQTSDQDNYEREWDTMNFHHKKKTHPHSILLSKKRNREHVFHN